MARKVCVVITARSSFSRVQTALEAKRRHPDLKLQLVVGASALLDRYGHALSVIEQQGFTVDRKIYTVVEGENLVTSAKSTGLGLAELASVFDDLRPDMVVTIADRHETIATAIAASFLNIPLVHVQGGEISGSIDEKVRHAVTKLADIHLVASDKAAERVRKMGERADRIFVTGCPSIDLAKQAFEAEPRDLRDIVSEYGGVGARIDLSRGYIVVLQHPVTTEFEAAYDQVLETLHAVSSGGWPTLWFWPNVDAGADATSKAIRELRELGELPNVHFYRNMKPLDFLSVLINSQGIAGNSSVAIRECAFLGVPAVNIGSRQAGRDRGRNVVDVGYDRDEIGESIADLFRDRPRLRDMIYGEGNAGRNIADVLAGCELTIEKMLTY